MKKHEAKLRPLVLATILSSYSSLSLGAQDNVDYLGKLLDLSLDELQDVPVTIASGLKQSLRESPASVTVITEAQWQSQGIQTLDQVLKTIPGVNVTTSTVALNSDIYSIRGLHSNFNAQVAVLMDGKPMRSSNGGSMPFGFKKSLIGIKQIEVIRGPASVIYGADNFSGVINLVTRKPEDPNSGNSMRLSAGSFNTLQMGTEQFFDWDGIKMSFMANLSKTDDDDERTIYSDLQSTFDGIFGTNASNAPGPVNNRHNIIELGINASGEGWNASLWRHQNRDGGLGTGAAQAIDPTGNFRNSLTKLDFLYDLPSSQDNTVNQFHFSWLKESFTSTYHIFPAGSVLPIGADGNLNFVAPTTFALFTEGFLGNPSNRSDVVDISYTSVSYPHASHKLRWEVGVTHRKRTIGETKNFGPTILNGTEQVVDGTLTDVVNTGAIYSSPVSEPTYFALIMDTWSISDVLTASLGARVDHYKSFSSVFNPRASLIWQANEDLSAKLVIGSGFRAPTNNERHFKNNPVTLGNPDIEPEEVDNIELIFDYHWNESLFTNLTLFRYKASELIEYVFEPSQQGNVAQNIGEQTGRGLEARAMWRPTEDLNIEFHVSYVDAEDGNSNPAANIPKTQQYLAFNWRVSDKVYWHLRTKQVLNRKRAAGDMRGPIKDYHVSDMSLTYEDPIPGMTLRLTANNLFDSEITEPGSTSLPQDYPMPGRQIMVGMEYHY